MDTHIEVRMPTVKSRTAARPGAARASRAALLSAAVLTSLTAANACDRSSGPSAPVQLVDSAFAGGSPFPGIVSNAVPASRAGSDAPSVEPELAVVSLVPNGAPTAASATIVNRRTHESISVPIVDGGLGPVPIGARASDTIVVTFAESAGPRQTWTAVPSSRRPAVVRTDPGASADSIAANATIRIVFSEPMDAGSVNASTITLLRDDVTVAGTADVRSDKPWIVEFVPAAPLAGGATYELVATAALRDLDGESLESPIRLNLTTAAAKAPLPGRIAFDHWNGSAIEIYTADPDGSHLGVLTEGMDPSFSPDGRRIAFWRLDSGAGAIYVANADGSDVKKVTYEGYQPAWSPDGSRLVYGCGGICIVNADGTGRQRVTSAAPAAADGETCMRDSDPAWSPDGRSIAFTRWPDAQIPVSNCLSLLTALDFPFDFWTEVWLVGVDGSGARAITDGTGAAVTYAGWPAWSPDGTRLAFYYVDGTDERIDIADVNHPGTITSLLGGPVNWNTQLGSPAWSPDGLEILFGTANGWGFAESSGSGRVTVVSSPSGIVPWSFSLAWGRD